MLVDWICTQSTEGDCYVMASPAGIPLYRKHGFQDVGVIETIHGCFTSMIKAR